MPDPTVIYPLLLEAARGRPHPEGVLVEHGESGAALVIDPVAWNVARTFDGATSCAEVAARFLEEAQPGAGAHMVLSLAAALAEQGLVTLRSAPLAPTPAHELDPSLPVQLEDTLATLQRCWVFDANHHVATLLLRRLPRRDRADLRGGMRTLYAGLQALAERGNDLLTPSLLVTTTLGRLALEEHLLASDLPTLPTVINTAREPDAAALRTHIDALLEAHPTHGGVVVCKNLLVHRGEAIRLVPLDELDATLAQARHLDVFQPLVPGPATDGHQRDYRCILVGGRLVSLWERRAADPLQRDGELHGADLQAVATNFHRGGSVRQLDPAGSPDLTALALRVAEGFDAAERAFRQRWGVQAPYPGSDYLSVDLLRGPDGAPVYCELHANPHFPEGVETAPVAEALAELAVGWCEREAGRQVLVVGDDTPGPQVAAECRRRGLSVRHLV